MAASAASQNGSIKKPNIPKISLRQSGHITALIGPNTLKPSHERFNLAGDRSFQKHSYNRKKPIPAAPSPLISLTES